MAIAIKTDYGVSDLYASYRENKNERLIEPEEENIAESEDEFYTNKEYARSQAMDMLDKYRNSIDSLYSDAFTGRDISGIQTVNTMTSVDYQDAALRLDNFMENIESEIRTIRLKMQNLGDSSNSSGMKLLQAKSVREASEAAQSVEAAAKREVMKIRARAGQVRIREKSERLEESSELKKNLQKIMKENKVTGEDLKGLEIDIDS